VKILVTGGVRSGKSFQAESLLLAEFKVTYIAPGPTAEEESDPDWTARLQTHQARRPSHWETVETRDLATAIAEADGAVIIDCLGTWVTALLDELDVWDSVQEDWETEVLERVDEALEAWRDSEATLIAVTNEVGMGVVPPHRSGRLFRDLLGTVNQKFAAECDEVHLVVAGRTLVL
jgi:adenosylcobinamide kinase/adenosylcobinamide-phosphate guanylyltransferase